MVTVPVAAYRDGSPEHPGTATHKKTIAIKNRALLVME
jgi:hypothetical protein